METVTVRKSRGGRAPMCKIPPASNTINVVIDDRGFKVIEYIAKVNDTICFQNDATADSLTVYILSQDGQASSSVLLGSLDQLNMLGRASVSLVVQASGNYVLSLDPAPRDAGNTDSPDLNGGKTSTIIVSS